MKVEHRQLTAEDLALAEEGAALGRELMRQQELGLIPARPPGTLLERMMEDGPGGDTSGDDTPDSEEDDVAPAPAADSVKQPA